MQKKVFILLEDDNEILGNGYGHPTVKQYLPTKEYLKILNKYGIKSSFYIDIAHYIFLKNNEDFDDFRFQAKTIEEVINLLVKFEMDVQLHLHSQWVNAKIINEKIYVTDKWNIGQLTIEEQQNLFTNAQITLKELLKKAGRENTLNSYKAGSWGLQPFNTLYDVFVKNGIRLVMGPIKGLKINSLNINYKAMESDDFPYFANKLDINKITDKSEITILPMTPTYLNWVDFIRYILEIKFKKLIGNTFAIDTNSIPDEVKKMKPLKGKDKLSLSLKPFKTHLKINYQKFWYLRNTFKRSYKKIKKSNRDYKLIVIETHTKDFKSNLNDIDKFFNLIKTKYKDVEFITSRQIVNDIQSGVLKPLQLDE